MRMLTRKVSICIVGILLSLFAKVYSQDIIVSPTNGIWANYQSLVLDLPENVEAYYSITGGNPLESGFAYDGPVLLELDGDISIQIAIVENPEKATVHTVNYSVRLEDTPEYISQMEGQPLIVINAENNISIPNNIQYTLSDSTNYSSGETLSVSGNMIFERNLLLTIKNGSVPYRYVLQVGDAQTGEIVDSVDNMVDITDWNYITFLHDGPIIYCIDNAELRQTKSGKIYVDRSVDRELKWRTSDAENKDEYTTLMLPKKPEVVGFPLKPSVNTPVTLQLSDERYSFAHPLSGSQVTLAKNYVIDTLNNDAFGFSEEIDIYFDGYKHGSINPAFIIDKVSPSTPIVTASSTSGFSREDVTLAVQATDTVYYYMMPIVNSKEGFNSDEGFQTQNQSFNSLDAFTVLDSDSIKLINNSGLARFYELYMYSADFAGNTSDIVSYKTIIDPYNYYLTNETDLSTDTPLGTKDKPFTDFLQLYSSLNKVEHQNVYIDGVFSDLSSINFTKDTTVYASDLTRLKFSTREAINVDGAKVTFFGGTIEQSNPDNAESLHHTLFTANDSTITLNNTEILLSGGLNCNAIVLDNSSIQVLNSGITVQTEGYGSGIKANNSVVLSTGSRFVIVAETAIGMSLVNTKTQVNDSHFTGIGLLSRAIEFIDSSYSLVNNSFVFNDAVNAKNIDYSAVWANNNTVQNALSNNNIEGFTSLLAN